MAVGPFTLMDAGLLGHQNGSINPAGAAMVAVLVLDAHGAPVVGTESTYADISGDESGSGDYSPVVLSLTVSEPSGGVVMVDMAEADFGSVVSITARYFYVLQGGANPVAGDLILGFMDLNDGGGGDVNSINSDFKVDANPSGLYRITAA